MAKKSPKIDPEKLYKVKLAAPIKIGRTLLRPRDTHRLKGSYVQLHIDAVASYEAA